MEERKTNLEKIFFIPGDVVMVRHDIENRPKMIVKTKSQFAVTSTQTKTLDGKVPKPAPSFHGMICYWFSDNKEYMEKVFNTKDLIHCDKDVK